MASRRRSRVSQQRLVVGARATVAALIAERTPIFAPEDFLLRSSRALLARIDELFTAMSGILAFDDEDAAVAGDIRAALERLGTPIGAYDILIAAQARRRGAVMVTANRREFQRVPGLMVADWTA